MLIFEIETHISAHDFTVFHIKDYKLALDGTKNFLVYLIFFSCFLQKQPAVHMENHSIR